MGFSEHLASSNTDWKIEVNMVNIFQSKRSAKCTYIYNILNHKKEIMNSKSI